MAFQISSVATPAPSDSTWTARGPGRSQRAWSAPPGCPRAHRRERPGPPAGDVQRAGLRRRIDAAAGAQAHPVHRAARRQPAQRVAGWNCPSAARVPEVQAAPIMASLPQPGRHRDLGPVTDRLAEGVLPGKARSAGSASSGTTLPSTASMMAEVIPLERASGLSTGGCGACSGPTAAHISWPPRRVAGQRPSRRAEEAARTGCAARRGKAPRYRATGPPPWPGPGRAPSPRAHSAARSPARTGRATQVGELYSS